MRDDETGKRALFGPAPAGKPGDHRRSLVTIDCARCGVSTKVGVGDALKRLVRFSLWIPGRTYSRRLQCPACQRRSWVRLRLL